MEGGQKPSLKSVRRVVIASASNQNHLAHLGDPKQFCPASQNQFELEHGGSSVFGFGAF